jgi:hypothetical protein
LGTGVLTRTGLVGGRSDGLVLDVIRGIVGPPTRLRTARAESRSTPFRERLERESDPTTLHLSGRCRGARLIGRGMRSLRSGGTGGAAADSAATVRPAGSSVVSVGVVGDAELRTIGASTDEPRTGRGWPGIMSPRPVVLRSAHSAEIGPQPCWLPPPPPSASDQARFRSTPSSSAWIRTRDLTIMSRAPPYEGRAQVGTRGKEIPAERPVPEGVGWPGAVACSRARGPVVDPAAMRRECAASEPSVSGRGAGR